MGFQQGEAMIGKQIDYVFLAVVLTVVLKTLELCIDCKGDKSRKRYSMAGSRITCCGSTNNRRRILDILTDSGFVLRQRMLCLLSDE
jgi:3-isopropylmalate/(R)-2-methylmalate dehydratase large subunit